MWQINSPPLPSVWPLFKSVADLSAIAEFVVDKWASLLVSLLCVGGLYMCCIFSLPCCTQF